MFNKFIFTACLLLSTLNSFAQNFRIDENKDSLMHYLNQQTSKNHPDAGVEIFYEIGTIENLTGTGISYKYEIAFKVYNKEAVGELLDIVIPKAKKGIVKRINAITYNLENGKIQETKLDKNDILLDDYSDNLELMKFSIPAVKNGSIVRYQYTCLNGHLTTRWNFQRENIPIAYSQYTFNISKNAIVTAEVSTTDSFKSYDSQKKFEKSKDKAASLNSLMDYGDLMLRSWIMRDIPPFIKEPLSGNNNQHLERVKVYFNGFSGDGNHFPIVESWDDFNQKAWYKGVFKPAFEKYKSLDEVGSEVLKSAKDSMDMAKQLYYLVQKQIQASGKNVEVKDIWSAKQGNSMSTAMFMCALYRNKGFYSDLVLLSNKESEKLSPFLFNVGDITNCIVRVIVNNVSYLVDPSEKDYPFGYLPTHYYNGYARIVNEAGGKIEINPQLAQNNNASNVIIKPVPENDGLFKINIKNKLGTYSALNVREEWKSDSIAFKKRFIEHSSDISKTIGFTIKNVTLDNYDNLDERLTLIMEGEVNFGKETNMIIYDPFFYKIFSDNILKDAAGRKYPIEFDYVSQDRYVLQFDLGDKYEVEELPQNKNLQLGNPAIIKFVQNAIFDPNLKMVLINYRYDNSATYISAENAVDLKEFYSEIIKNFNQKLIIKKK